MKRSETSAFGAAALTKAVPFLTGLTEFLLCPFVGAVQTNVCGNFWQFWPVNLAKSYGFLLLRVSAELVQAAIPVAGHVMRKAVDDLRHGHGIDKIDASDLQC